MTNRLQTQLSQQLSFITTSCEAYDAGHTEEAIRIGTSLRVLLHDTRKSTSLLKQLGQKSSVPLLSTCPVYDTLPLAFDGLSNFSPLSPEGFRPKLDLSSTKVLLPAMDWWLQPVIGLGNGSVLSRSILALTAANKDGGAHVDPDLPADYMQMIEGVWTDSQRGPITDFHLLYLRQMGYEILNSPALIALAD